MPAASPRHDADDLGDQDLTAKTLGAEPRSLDDWVAEAVALVADNIAPAQPRAQFDGMRRTAIRTLRALLHRDCTRDSSGCRGEEDHDPVTQVLDLLAAVFGDGFAQDGEVLAAGLLGRVRRHPGHQSSGVDDVGEEKDGALQRFYRHCIRLDEYAAGAPGHNLGLGAATAMAYVAEGGTSGITAGLLSFSMIRCPRSSRDPRRRWRRPRSPAVRSGPAVRPGQHGEGRSARP